MSLAGSFYSGVTGLQAHSTNMSVIGNNLANVSTMGYKKTTAQFQDIFYSGTNTGGGPAQIGHGVQVASMYRSFEQGSFMASSDATDLAMSGQGFFTVRDPLTDESYYTRAGNFRFDDEGYLTDPTGKHVQGWEVGDNGSLLGTEKDVRLETTQSDPSATKGVDMSLNLDAGSKDKSTNTVDPFFALQQKWDATAEPPLPEDAYAYHNTIRVYDENGAAHDLTVYFDPVTDNVADDGSVNWEFIVTCDPAEDGRIFNDGAGGADYNLGQTAAGGLLMSGTLAFGSNGKLQNMSAFTLNNASTPQADIKGLANWTPATMGADGLPEFTANFSGNPDGASVTNAANSEDVIFDLGIQSTSNTWGAGGVANAAAIGVNTAGTHLLDNDEKETDADATTSHEAKSARLFHSQDGYASGFLTSYDVDENGVLMGRYSNGQVIDLFALVTANFTNEYGLHAEGANLFSATRDSGQALLGQAGTGVFGTMQSYTLEGSNVDMSSEMVSLITTQRGFQANSKVITTADTMMDEVIRLKR